MIRVETGALKTRYVMSVEDVMAAFALLWKKQTKGSFSTKHKRVDVWFSPRGEVIIEAELLQGEQSTEQSGG